MATEFVHCTAADGQQGVRINLALVTNIRPHPAGGSVVLFMGNEPMHVMETADELLNTRPRV